MDSNAETQVHLRKTYEILISGTVQGVGYRNYCLGLARKINVVGYVCNTKAGKVKIEANLTEQERKYFLSELKAGTPSSKVSTVVHKEIPPKNYIGFHIRLELP